MATTATQAGIELETALELLWTDPGSGTPRTRFLRAETIIGGGPDCGCYSYLAGVFRSILPLMERFGVATPDEVAIETLADRLREETVARGGVVALQTIFGAAARES